jgi:3-hydroxyacyl-[acyl-carrier-protein] dehydratase
MKFQLIDAILEQSSERILAVKQVSLAEEYLGDHFPGFPVLPGVMMIETMAQAARALLGPRGDARLVLGEVRALKFGNMVRPGQILEVEVTLAKAHEDGSYTCKGTGAVRDAACSSEEETSREIAVSGRFTMRPIRSA